jgi:uncharacterized membrane protein
MQVGGFGDLTVASVASVICAAALLAIPVAGGRVPFGVLLCLVLPGYSLTCAIFARRPLALPLMVALTVAVSLAVLVLGSVLLQVIPGGLTIDSWAILLAVVVLASCVIAALRRNPSAWRPTLIRLPHGRRFEIALVALGCLAAAAAIGLARVPLSAPKAQGYTQLWMLPDSTRHGPGVVVGVGSGEQRPVRYRLHLSTGSHTLVSIRFQLRPGSRIRMPIAVPLGGKAVGPPRKVVASLYRQDAPRSVYRRVFVWLASGGASAAGT